MLGKACGRSSHFFETKRHKIGGPPLPPYSRSLLGRVAVLDFGRGCLIVSLLRLCFACTKRSVRGVYTLFFYVLFGFYVPPVDWIGFRVAHASAPM